MRRAAAAIALVATLRPMRVPRHCRPTTGATWLLAGLMVAGCAFVGGDSDAPRLRAQAQAALARWAEAVAAAGASSFAPVGELTSQIGTWESTNGENKASLYSGVVEAVVELPSAVPPDGQIRWSDGTTSAVSLISAGAALEAIRAGSVQPCPECPVLRVTGARLTTGTFETNRGQAVAPIWAFSVAGTAVEITRLATASTITVIPPPWDPNNPPIGLSIDRASVAPDGRHVTVMFVGAPDPASQPCGEDYAAEGVESAEAVVVIVHVHRNPTLGACAAVGAQRTATLELAAPLGNRAILEVTEGRPVPVTRE